MRTDALAIYFAARIDDVFCAPHAIIARDTWSLWISRAAHAARSSWCQFSRTHRWDPCRAHGVEFLQFPVGLSILTHPNFCYDGCQAPGTVGCRPYTFTEPYTSTVCAAHAWALERAAMQWRIPCSLELVGTITSTKEFS